MDREIDNYGEALAYLLEDGNLACFSTFGNRTADCAPFAYALALSWANSNGEPVTTESLDSAMGRVVNDDVDIDTLIYDVHLVDDPMVVVAIYEAHVEALRRDHEDEVEKIDDKVFDLDCKLEEAVGELSDLRSLADAVLDIQRGLADLSEVERRARVALRSAA